MFGAENPRVRYLLGTCQFHTAKKRRPHVSAGDFSAGGEAFAA